MFSELVRTTLEMVHNAFLSSCIFSKGLPNPPHSSVDDGILCDIMRKTMKFMQYYEKYHGYYAIL